VQCYLDAAERGYPSAQFSAAECLQKGVGIPPDPFGALYWCVSRLLCNKRRIDGRTDGQKEGWMDRQAEG
jgi:hypothetical protein